MMSWETKVPWEICERPLEVLERPISGPWKHKSVVTMSECSCVSFQSPRAEGEAMKGKL